MKLNPVQEHFAWLGLLVITLVGMTCLLAPSLNDADVRPIVLLDIVGLAFIVASLSATHLLELNTARPFGAFSIVMMVLALGFGALLALAEVSVNLSALW